MTLKDLITTATNWKRANEAAEKISKELAAVRREYIGVSAVEVMPNGNRVTCIIAQIEWESTIGLNGGWSVGVFYTSGLLQGQFSYTSDQALELGSK